MRRIDVSGIARTAPASPHRMNQRPSEEEDDEAHAELAAEELRLDEVAHAQVEQHGTRMTTTAWLDVTCSSRMQIGMGRQIAMIGPVVGDVREQEGEEADAERHRERGGEEDEVTSAATRRKT